MLVRWVVALSNESAMSVTRNNHYVPQWYQEGFFEPGPLVACLCRHDAGPEGPSGRPRDHPKRRVERYADL